MKKILFPLLTILSAIAVNAQCILGETVKAQLVEDWEQAKVLTNEYLNIMPADKYSSNLKVLRAILRNRCCTLRR